MKKTIVFVNSAKFALFISVSLFSLGACKKNSVSEEKERSIKVENFQSFSVSITSPIIGADTNSADNRAAIQTALDASGIIYIPTGTFKVKGTLNVSANTTITGPGTLKQVDTANVPFLKINAVSHVTIRDITIIGNNGLSHGVKNAKGTIHVLGGGSYLASDIHLLHLNIGNAYDYAIEGDHASQLTIDSCHIYSFGNRGINLDFSNHTHLDYNLIDGFVSGTTKGVHGIEVWGKTSTSTKGSTDHTITHNTVQNVSGGGIWTSYATQITANYNTVSNCGDVGIDGEATSYMTIQNNTVSNCKNGAITTFFASDNFDISNNQIHQDSGYGAGIYFYGTGISNLINVKDNNIYVANNYAIYSITNVISNSTIQNNSITCPATIAIYLNGDNQISILNNMINVGTASTISVNTGIFIGGGSYNVITGNTVKSLYDSSIPITSANASKAGIHLYWRDATYVCQHNQVKNNTITGFTNSVNDNCWGNIASYNEITNNKLLNVYRRSGTGYVGTISGNKLASDTTIAVSATLY